MSGIKAFMVTNEAFYARSLPPDRPNEIMIGFYYEEGGTDGEFAIRWRDVAPRLEVFEDAWKALKQMPELLDLLAQMDGKNITPKELSSELLKIGFKDYTEREERW